MHPIFRGDFTLSTLASYTVEQHVPDGYSDFAIRDGKLALLDAGNRLLPNAPALTTFVLRGEFEADWDLGDGACSLQVFFAYDTQRRQGLLLEFGARGAEGYARLLSPGGELIAEAQWPGTPAVGGSVGFDLQVGESSLALALNGSECFAAALPPRAPGRIALCRGAFLGELRLRSLQLDSADPLVEEPVLTDLHLPFAPLNGMDIPIVWTVNAVRVGEAVRVEVELSGGEKSRPDVPWFPYHGHYAEFLDRPYLRIESPRGATKLPLSDETLVLARPHKQYFYSRIGHREPPWPYRRTFYLPDLPPGAVLVAGYEAYGNRGVSKHLEVDSPYETVYDTARGAVVSAGPAVPPGAVNVELKSPDDKQLCRDLPASLLNYGRALAFARANHYFSAGEECRFRFEVTCRDRAARDLLRVDYRLESAFFEPLTEYVALTPLPGAQASRLPPAVSDVALEPPLPGLQRLYSPWFSFGVLAPGVYHVRFRLLDGVTVQSEQWRALEVLGETQSGAAASRLPVCFSMSNEVKGQDTDYFDPWRADCVDVSHYVSIVTGMMPHFAREKRLWEALKPYRREWFLWLAGRVMQDYRLESNHDLIRACDYLYPGDPQDVYYRLAARQFYHPALVARLYEFAQATGFRVEEIRACHEAGTLPDKATFDALVAECFYEWVDFFWRRRVREYQQFAAAVEEICAAPPAPPPGARPRPRIASYGPAAVYGGLYKTAHACTYAGSYLPCPEMEAFRDGYFMLEDYPHACRYSLHSGPFFLASFKALAPAVTVYPELYNETGARVPCPDAAVARAWPSYGMWGRRLAINASLKCVLEYVFAAVWHDGEGFHYWRDYGFHTRVWERERFAALLKLWGFVDRARPRRPLKAPAFVCNEACCRHHRLWYDEYPGDGHEAFGDLFNTAEECSAYAYELSRVAGQNAGFVTDFARLETLGASDIEVLVLPPLTQVSAGDLAQVRRLHEAGVPLLAFENVAGLEDLFGVTPGDPVQVHEIRVNAALPDNPLAPLADLREYTTHRACVGTYRATTAAVLLEGEAPVLFLNQTPWGQAALYNLPPTAVRRQDQFNRVAMGRASISPLVNRATQLLLRHLGRPAVAVSEGKVIAFEDEAGQKQVIVTEDAYPLPARAIRPVVTINLPYLDPRAIRCDRDFTVEQADAAGVRLSLHLGPDEFAILSLP